MVMDAPRFSPLLAMCLLLCLHTASTTGQTSSPQQTDASVQQAGTSSSPAVLRTTVRRVVIDVIVTDSKGEPVKGLSKEDFLLQEDGEPQQALSFEANGFDAGMDYVPPKLPSVPPNTFLDLPSTPEKGPLYVLLYDLVNMDNEDQMGQTVNQHPDQIRGRQQLLKFIQNKPEGARFAIFVRSDGLHLLQGFTSDKAKLLAAVDPHSSHPHLPEVYLMGQNMGRGDPETTRDVLQQIAAYFDGIPGRKNLIWFSGGFPLLFFPGKDDGPDRTREIKATLNLLSQNRIAIYPVDVRGVVSADYHSTSGLPDDKEPISQGGKGGTSTSTASGSVQEPPPGPHGENTHQGASLLNSSYFAQDEIARQTGGRAFYSRNDVADALTAATETGNSYYTLTYSPTNRNYDGNLRHIKVELAQKGYTLAYRRSYFATEAPLAAGASTRRASTLDEGTESLDNQRRPAGDSLSAIMRHGAPAMHQIVFGVQVHAVGGPVPGTPEQMARLVTQSEVFAAQAKHTKGKPLPPIPLQHYRVDFLLLSKQFADKQSPVTLEFAAAAYDADARMLNATVQTGTRQPSSQPTTGGTAATPRGFRTEQDLDVPPGATSLRFAVRETSSDRLGALELNLPLPPEVVMP